MLKSIALKNLVPSARNVRRSSDTAADAELAADIVAHGLLQNLVVTPGKPRGTYAVEAGGRRLRALQALQADGALPEDHKVACLVLGKDSDLASAATEASLAENLQRLAMNPADECLAFGRLIEEGADLEGVARRFGLTVRHVEGRLRLAGLHPTVFEALGAGDITLDAAKAYAATPDRERQLWVFEQLHESWSGAHPDSIRRMMVSATVPASDRRFRFVGEEAYREAGGRIERDLFADEDEARVLDVAVLEQLATDRLEVEAAWLANEHGYAFVHATLDSYIQSWRHEDLRHAAIEVPEPDEKERAMVDALEAEIDGLYAAIEDEGTEEQAHKDAEARIAQVEAEIRTIMHRPPVLDPEVRGTVGFFLKLDEAGVPRLDRTPFALVADHQQEEGSATGDPGDGACEEAGDGKSKTFSGSAAETAGSDGAPAKPKLSQRLVDELAVQRRDILALHVARDPELAFDLAVFLMVRDEGEYCYDTAGSSLAARHPSDPVLRSAIPDAPVQAHLAKVDDGLDRGWTAPETLAERFDAFRKLPRSAREAWLGATVANTLEASAGAGGRQCAFHDHLATLLGIEVEKHWRPTALNWFDRVTKALCLAALNEVGGPELAARHAKAKKAEIAEACEKVFAGEGIVEPEVKAAALTWVPEPMRFVAAVETDADTPPWNVDEDISSGPAQDDEGPEPEPLPQVDTGELRASDPGADNPEPADETLVRDAEETDVDAATESRDDPDTALDEAA